MSEADRARLAESLAPYTRDSAGHYTYRVKDKEAVQAHLQRIGQNLQSLLRELRPTYAADNAFQVLERLFTENFNLVESQARPKENLEITSGCLQSVDDLEATYRTKGNAHYTGYVANLTETCDPANELQLITKVQVTPNNVDDSQLLADALPNLKARTELETMITDGGYGGKASDTALQTAQATLTQTAICGRSPHTEKLHLSNFSLKFNPDDKPAKVACPQGQIVLVHTSAHQKAFVAHFDNALCQVCPLLERCPLDQESAMSAITSTSPRPKPAQPSGAGSARSTRKTATTYALRLKPVCARSNILSRQASYQCVVSSAWLV